MVKPTIYHLLVLLLQVLFYSIVLLRLRHSVHNTEARKLQFHKWPLKAVSKGKSVLKEQHKFYPTSQYFTLNFQFYTVKFYKLFIGSFDILLAVKTQIQHGQLFETNTFEGTIYKIFILNYYYYFHIFILHFDYFRTYYLKCFPQCPKPEK